VALSADGKRVLTGSADRTAILWNAQGGAKLRSFPGHTDEVRSVAISGDWRRVFTGWLDRGVIVWDSQSDQQPVFRIGR
jgi:WD40 repeat protein